MRVPYLSWAPVALGFILVVGTILTQVGGVIFVGCWWVFRQKCFATRRYPRTSATVAALAVYLVSTLWIVPPLAGVFGREPLPWRATASVPLAPRNPLYCLLNRHYVTPELREVLTRSAKALEQRHPGSVVHYLDANLPFFDGFPLIPHLSHDDGRKIDFTFCYRKRDQYSMSPSAIGYWIYEAPQPGEANPYANKGCWLRWDFPWFQNLNRQREFDPVRTRTFLRILLSQPETEKVLLELHLQHRMGLSHPKLRFQQCMAARHDDHIHFQVSQSHQGSKR